VEAIRDGKGSISDTVKRWKESLGKVRDSFDYKPMLAAASGWSDRIVRLIAIFILQTIVLPIAFLCAAWRIARFFVISPSVITPPQPR
jgi:hypothetical protein